MDSERKAILEDLKNLVQSESPSTSVDDLARTVDILKKMIERITGITPQEEEIQGKTILSITYGEKTGKRVLVLCHYDTVWPVGTLSRLPFKIDGNTCSGPGVFDMKSGILMALYAIRFLQSTGNRRAATILITPDEELGSEASKDLILKLARSSEAVFVLEASEKGMLKVGRKGVGTFKVEAIGKASHAGLDPDAGVNAITEISHIVHDVEKFADRMKGTTVNV
ncbi:glutamate carboxypeptidase, partial [mine drainage metagenome]